MIFLRGYVSSNFIRSSYVVMEDIVQGTRMAVLIQLRRQQAKNNKQLKEKNHRTGIYRKREEDEMMPAALKNDDKSSNESWWTTIVAQSLIGRRTGCEAAMRTSVHQSGKIQNCCGSDRFRGIHATRRTDSGG